MTGPEHYREAEIMLESAYLTNSDPVDLSLLAAAQVHALLAIAAGQHSSSTFKSRDAWKAVVE